MNTLFQSLLREFSSAKGMQADEAAYGLEFSCDGHQVTVIGHPRHEDELMVSISVASLEGELDPRVATLLMQINEVARFEHDWSIFMDAEQQVSMGMCAALPSMTVADLEALMLDGVERASVLLNMLSGMQTSNPKASPALEVPRDIMQLRG